MIPSDEDERTDGATEHDEVPEQDQDPKSSGETNEESVNEPEPRDESPERDPAVAEIEDDPSRNPDNDLLRDIKGG